jgi:hypothetical protein
MKQTLRCLCLSACIGLLSACAGQTQVFSTDLTTQSGVYILGYTTNSAIRIAMEDQLVADLARQDMLAWASHNDLPDLQRITPPDVVAAANGKQAIGVVLINQVAADASDSVLSNPDRVTPLHPDLQAFFQEAHAEMEDNVEPGTPVFAEVNLFLVDGAATRLYWSGTTWSFHADGNGTAIREISATIATQMRNARREFARSGGRGN